MSKSPPRVRYGSKDNRDPDVVERLFREHADSPEKKEMVQHLSSQLSSSLKKTGAIPNSHRSAISSFLKIIDATKNHHKREESDTLMKDIDALQDKSMEDFDKLLSQRSHL